MELEEILQNDKNKLFCMHMEDKYGEYGIISAALVVENTIDTFVLSCRTFGRSVETAFLIYLMETLKNLRYNNMFGSFIPSKKNNMTCDFYKNCGFKLYKESQTNQLWEFDFSSPVPSFPRWIGKDVT